VTGELRPLRDAFHHRLPRHRDALHRRSGDRAVVILPNQGLEAVIVGKASSLGPGRQADRLLDIDETSLLVRMCDA
jgi:hypothetical protein